MDTFDYSQPGPSLVKAGDRRIGQRVEKINGAFHRVPNLPSEKWIDAHGNVVVIPIHCTRNIKDVPVQGHPYGTWVRSKKRRLGWIPYDEPPPGISAAQWESCEREKLIAARRSNHITRDQQYQQASERLQQAEATKIANAFKQASRELDAERQDARRGK